MNFSDASKRDTVTQREALDIFDSLETANLKDLFGLWKGVEFLSGHQMDGGLTAMGWFGKRFVNPETVDPLLFLEADDKSFFAADPQKVFSLGTGIRISDHRDEVFTQEPKARLRMMSFRGQYTATMIYDNFPIHDHFKVVDERTLFGAMDVRGDPTTYFFALYRV